jgi:hypothetical protein
MILKQAYVMNPYHSGFILSECFVRSRVVPLAVPEIEDEFEYFIEVRFATI